MARAIKRGDIWMYKFKAYVATLPPRRMREVCRGLAIATGCDQTETAV